MNQQSVSCYLCNSETTTRYFSIPEYIEHLSSVHHKKYTSSYFCTFCSKFFSRRNAFTKHLKNVHDFPNHPPTSDLVPDDVIGPPENERSSSANSAAPLPPDRGVSSSNVDLPREQDIPKSTQKEVASTQNVVGNLTITDTSLTQESYEPNFLQISHNDIDSVIGESISKLEAGALEFALTLHAKPSMPRSTVIEIQNIAKKSLFKVIADMLEPVVQLIPSEIQGKFQKVLVAIKNPFIKINSDYMLRKYLERKQLICNPRQVTIDNRVSEVYVNGQCTFKEHKTKAVMLPFDFVFKKFLEKDNKIEEAIKNHDRLIQEDGGKREHFVQCSLWKEKLESYKDEIVLPLFWYGDGYGINNPLGSKSCSIESSYFSFPTLENPLAEQNILSAAFLKTSDLKKFGTGKCFVHYIDALNVLAIEGIIFTVNNTKKRVKFCLALLLGDNLGINTYLDLNSHSAKKFCRFCSLSTTETRAYGREDPTSLRTIENYNDDVQKSNPVLTGIKRDCSLNKIKHFHVTKNKHVDLMHDWFEGILHYCMCRIILELIKCEFFTLDMLNNRISTFSYGSIEIGNRPEKILLKHLENSSLKMTTRQIWCFTNYFGLMIGDLVIDKENQYWIMYLKLLDLMDFLLASKFDDNTLDHMTELIDEFNTMYISLFNDTLKPKFHNLTHYPTIIRHSGPPRFYSSIRFEAKHQSSKKYCNAITSRKNILLSLAKKVQLSFAHYLMFTPKLNDVIYLPKHKVKTTYKQLFQSTPFDSYKLIKYQGTEYKISCYLSADHEGINSLYEIKEIAISESSVVIVAERMAKLDYNTEYHCHQISEITKTTMLMDITKFTSLPLNIFKIPSGTFVKLKSYFHCIQ